ncbi:DNA replication/repair protein RecF [Paenibacillus apiarius]|uniref:DNA replication and repair protein RecF n=1 Tax=Paenibacillus apiarius TaxID=46240 RepID=A0ABT4DYX4_9BACL|nr:DNA replication/repair protein RecF [Paenibacillus apiarius]MBN3524306.1 DNA replication/repair protein RecF [Paenibacillus apiarius]MCY9514101.1 DNA replication/repair protein RecF [Paenibacillus apiarius]MCY9522559.1 DNA replication/repair protein RecF [Paenibacillus apiarius]MCY9552985.1 DNA replication/repair protein RecF [Paenibacillus apiarius]MCY9556374.1 DNA replication/repair protein RecF [Paenibacillus apiarius]
MFVKSVALKQYRNYEALEMDTSNRVNIFVGNNAQGKTNLLESIFVLALTKSHRTSRDKELIGWEAEQAQLKAAVDRKYGTVQLELNISRQGKKAKLNGLEQKKLSGFIGALNVVMFAPEDLEIVKGAPGIRRRFLDMEIAQVQPSYLYHLQQYQKVLAQRNNLLKQMWSGPSAQANTMLEIFNEQLADNGVKVIKKRKQYLKKLQAWAEQIHAGITNEREALMVEYAPSFTVSDEDDAVLFEQFMIKLTQMKDQEVRRGMTLVGPHRDDLAFFINGKEVQTYGSQGQQRTTALSLKLAEIELMHEEIGEYPVLLLDDVLSELDSFRQTQLIETFQSKVQTFITTTGIEGINTSKLQDANMFHVENGQVKR